MKASLASFQMVCEHFRFMDVTNSMLLKLGYKIGSLYNQWLIKYNTLVLEYTQRGSNTLSCLTAMWLNSLMAFATFKFGSKIRFIINSTDYWGASGTETVPFHSHWLQICNEGNAGRKPTLPLATHTYAASYPRPYCWCNYTHLVRTSLTFWSPYKEQLVTSRVRPTWAVPWVIFSFSITRGSSFGIRYFGSPKRGITTTTIIHCNFNKIMLICFEIHLRFLTDSVISYFPYIYIFYST